MIFTLFFLFLFLIYLLTWKGLRKTALWLFGIELILAAGYFLNLMTHSAGISL